MISTNENTTLVKVLTPYSLIQLHKMLTFMLTEGTINEDVMINVLNSAGMVNEGDGWKDREGNSYDFK